MNSQKNLSCLNCASTPPSASRVLVDGDCFGSSGHTCGGRRKLHHHGNQAPPPVSCPGCASAVSFKACIRRRDDSAMAFTCWITSWASPVGLQYGGVAGYEKFIINACTCTIMYNQQKLTCTCTCTSVQLAYCVLLTLACMRSESYCS